MSVNPGAAWWMEHTAAGRRFARRVLPRSAWSPRQRREAEEEERRDEERREKARRPR
jgi:hypothetical protein